LIILILVKAGPLSSPTGLTRGLTDVRKGTTLVPKWPEILLRRL